MLRKQGAFVNCAIFKPFHERIYGGQGATGCRLSMLQFCSLQHSLGAGLLQLRADGRLLSGTACQSVLQTLRRSLAAAPPPPPLLPATRPSAQQRALHACASTGGQHPTPSGVLEDQEKDQDLQKQQKQQVDASGRSASSAALGTNGRQGEAQPVCSTTAAFGQVRRWKEQLLHRHYCSCTVCSSPASPHAGTQARPP